jgi:hypothetical protein
VVRLVLEADLPNGDVETDRVVQKADPTFEITEFLSLRARAPLAEYEVIETASDHLHRNFRQRLEEALNGQVGFGGSPLQSLDPPIDWSGHNRSMAVRLAAWNSISNFLIGHSFFGDIRFFNKAWNYAISWLKEFQQPAFAIGPDPAALSEAFGPAPWYDSAVGQRVYRIAYMLDYASRHAEYSDEDVELLFRSMIFHLRLLERDDFFQPQNNHGLVQALGELAAARRFREIPYLRNRFEAAKRRVAEVIDLQFHPIGIHRDNSPGYHFPILYTIIGACRCGLLDEAGLDDRLAQLEEMLTWMVQGNGNLLTFGDSNPRCLSRGRALGSVFRDPGLLWYCSNGKAGAPPPAGLRALPHEGYVFARSAAPTKRNDPWWYFAQMASFHSRAHKHADDLSFVWSDHGCEILIDPGRYAYAGKTEQNSELEKLGFWYSDPKRIYVESTRAHNTVEIDSRSYNRRRDLSGSALRHAREQDGLIVTECEVTHEGVSHWRMLVLRPSAFLLVIDSLDDPDHRHDFRQSFLLHPSWRMADNGPSGLTVRRTDPGKQLRILALAPDQKAFGTARGQPEPELLGWYSDRANSLQPCMALFSEQHDTNAAVFATLFTFEVNAVPEAGATSVLESMRPSYFSWFEDGGLITVSIARSLDDAVPSTVKFERRSRDARF